MKYVLARIEVRKGGTVYAEDSKSDNGAICIPLQELQDYGYTIVTSLEQNGSSYLILETQSDRKE